jgi:hypothetical protein
MARIERDSTEVGPSAIGSSTLAQVFQTQESVDVELEGKETELNTKNDDDAIMKSTLKQMLTTKN